MARIFLSYAHEDQPTAKRLVEALAREGLHAWWDHDIPPGKTWDEVIGARIDAADIVMVIWSRRAVASNFVKEEAQLALDAGKLLPLKIDAIDPPIGFRRVQAANLSDWRGEAEHGQWRVVLSEIQARLGDAPLKAPAPGGRAVHAAAIAVGVAALMALGAFVALSRAHGPPRPEQVAAVQTNAVVESAPAPATTSARAVDARRSTPAPSMAVENVARTVWQGPVFRASGRTSEWAVRFNDDGTAAIDFLDGRGFMDTGDWTWTQNGGTVHLTHAPSGNSIEGTLHDREMSGLVSTLNSERDNGTFRFTRR